VFGNTNLIPIEKLDNKLKDKCDTRENKLAGGGKWTSQSNLCLLKVNIF